MPCLLFCGEAVSHAACETFFLAITPALHRHSHGDKPEKKKKKNKREEEEDEDEEEGFGRDSNR
jgi:ribosomal protein L12E/L44/L45/RPP1/RPP2